MRQAVYLLFFLVPLKCAAQNDFCEALSAILRDAPNQFRNVRTNLVKTDLTFRAYSSGIHIPGAIQERFMEARGLFYEGAMGQSSSPDSLIAKYNWLGNALDSCLKPYQFTRSKRPLFDPKLKGFDKVVFLPPYDQNTDIRSLKGHVSMEVDFNKNNGTYTLELFIYQH